ncbi:MAG: hypothetical protein JWN40_1881 [Phycisphaerales bacterium]|nr:hypothetical protein [Phycisphaerales bacterium]
MSLVQRFAVIVALLCSPVPLRAADPPPDKSIFDFGNKKPPAATDKTVADPTARATVKTAIKETNQAILRGDYDQAVKSATAADAAARAANDPALAATAAQRLTDVRLLQAEAAKAAPAIAKLAIAPDDAGANVEAGRFLCFWRGEWDKGLPLLSKGSDSGLKAIAQEDLAAGADVPMQFAVANAWWDLAANLEGPPRAYAQDRAAEGYVKVVAKLEGLNHVTAQKRIAEAPVRLPFPKSTDVAVATTDAKTQSPIQSRSSPTISSATSITTERSFPPKAASSKPRSTAHRSSASRSTSSPATGSSSTSPTTACAGRAPTTSPPPASPKPAPSPSPANCARATGAPATT